MRVVADRYAQKAGAPLTRLNAARRGLLTMVIAKRARADMAGLTERFDKAPNTSTTANRAAWIAAAFAVVATIAALLAWLWPRACS